MEIAAVAANLLSYEDDTAENTPSLEERREHEPLVRDLLCSYGITLAVLGRLIMEQDLEYPASSPRRKQINVPKHSIAYLLGYEPDEATQGKVYSKLEEDEFLDAFHDLGLVLQDLAGYFPAIDRSLLEDVQFV